MLPPHFEKNFLKGRKLKMRLKIRVQSEINEIKFIMRKEKWNFKNKDKRYKIKSVNKT
jgi:hypothetical protein